MGESGEKLERIMSNLHKLIQTGKFERYELDFIIEFCNGIIKATQKLIDRVEGRNE